MLDYKPHVLDPVNKVACPNFTGGGAGSHIGRRNRGRKYDRMYAGFQWQEGMKYTALWGLPL